MEDSYSRRKIKANAGNSQLRVPPGNSHQEALSDGKSASPTHATGSKTPANTYWSGPVSNSDAGTSRPRRHDALRPYFRVRAGQARAHPHDTAPLRPRR